MSSDPFPKRPTASETDDDLLQMQQEWEMSRKTQKPSVEIHRVKKRPQNSEISQKIDIEDGKIDTNSENSQKIDNLIENRGKSEFSQKIDKIVEFLQETHSGTEKIDKTAGISQQIDNRDEKIDNPTENQGISEFPQKIDKNQGGRFLIDIDDSSEASGVLFPVVERNSTWKFEQMTEDLFKYSKDDGFPEPLDLSKYFLEKDKSQNPGTKSFFAAEFDRIHGNLSENLDFIESEETETFGIENLDFSTENEKYLKSLDLAKIEEMKLEVAERFDPKMLEFLRNRGKTDKEKEKEEAPKKISKFKERKMQKSEKKIEEKKVEISNPVVKEMMDELEVLEEWTDRDDMEKYNRLATDAIQLDLTAKFGRNLTTRQQKNAVKLFDNCKYRPENSEIDPLLEKARSQIDEIKKLYLEEIQISENQIEYQFGKGLNPIIDACWTLQPIRRCLDFIENRRNGQVIDDDIEIVRLSLLWTLLLFSERKSAFFAFAEPNDFFVHLSEVYLIGAEVLSDDVIAESAERLLNGYIQKCGEEGKLGIRMNQKVAGLDAFMPFYEQLLKNYEQYSMGDAGFATAILIGAYLNAPIGDSIEYRFALWSPKRHTIRQMTVSSNSRRDLLKAIKKQISERENVIYEQHYVQYCSLLGAYVTAIRDDVITRDRNSLMFEIAAFEIGRFLERTKKMDSQQREFQILTEIIQKSIGDKLNFC